MLIRTIIDQDNERKWEIYQNDNRYSYKYYEFYNNISWRLLWSEENFTKDAIEFEFDVVL